MRRVGGIRKRENAVPLIKCLRSWRVKNKSGFIINIILFTTLELLLLGAGSAMKSNTNNQRNEIASSPKAYHSWAVYLLAKKLTKDK